MALPDVREVARGRWRGILVALGLPEEALQDRHGPCPLCGGVDRFRFDDQDGRGTYHCNQCRPGDGVQLAMAFTGLPFREAAQQIEKLAGVVQQTPCKATRTDEEKKTYLRKVWCESHQVQHGDEVMTYLARRGMRMIDIPDSLRLHPGLRYRNKDGSIAGTFPVMLSTVTAPTGEARSIHRTWVQNGAKANVKEPRKMMEGLGIAGCAIRLAPVSHRLGIAEGIETALAAAELFEMPVWSCISTSGIESFEPPVGVEELVIFADNDDNFAGQRAAYIAGHRLRLRGFQVEVVIPPTVGHDWNDELVARRTRA